MSHLRTQRLSGTGVDCVDRRVRVNRVPAQAGDKDVFEIDVEIRREPDSISVTHRWRTTSQKELWLNNIVEIRIENNEA